MLFGLTLIESFISIYWLLTGSIFFKVGQISNRCMECFFLSLVYIFIQTFDWAFFMCSLHNLVQMVSDPFKQFAFDKRLKLYIIFSLSMSTIYLYMILATGTFGLSVKYNLILFSRCWLVLLEIISLIKKKVSAFILYWWFLLFTFAIPFFHLYEYSLTVR